MEDFTQTFLAKRRRKVKPWPQPAARNDLVYEPKINSEYSNGHQRRQTGEEALNQINGFALTSNSARFTHHGHVQLKGNRRR
jgi:hypothetical protein